MDATLLIFLGISAVVIVTPGQDTALSLRNAIAGGRAAGLATALGVAAGQLIWAVSAAAGLVAVLAAMEGVFTAIKYAGALYLIFLGLQSLRSALTRSAAPDLGAGAPRRLAARKAFAQGILSNLGNPKMAIFFASLLPQFVADGAAAFAIMLSLGAIFSAMTLTWLSFYAFAVAWAGALLQKPSVRRCLDAVTGTALIGLGLRLSVLER